MYRFNTLLASLAALALAGCTPQNATLESGQYWAFMSEATSFSIINEVIDPTDWKDGYNVDCRVLTDKEAKVLRLDDPYEVCQCSEDTDPEAGGCKSKNDADPNDVGWPPTSENWMTESGWHVLTEPLEPWRGEAVITSEGDLQIGFHHRVPGGEDFRFAFVVDPQFQPKRCVPGADGKLDSEPIDGDWVAQWTDLTLHTLNDDDDGDGVSELDGDCNDHDPDVADEDPCYSYDLLAPYVDKSSARLYSLNARGFQFNPADTTVTWPIPDEWQAGYASGKFADENFHARAPRWAIPILYEFVEAGAAVEGDPNNLYYCNWDCIPGDEVVIDPTDPDPPTRAELNEEYDECVAEWEECMVGKEADAQAAAMDSALEWAQVGVGIPTTDSKDRIHYRPTYAPLVHNNSWREPRVNATGFDSWVGYHPSYVVIDGKVEVGEPLKGAFAIVFDADESNSRWFVQGEFSVDRVKKDRWTTKDLRAEKHEENGTSRCNL